MAARHLTQRRKRVEKEEKKAEKVKQRSGNMDKLLLIQPDVPMGSMHDCYVTVC